MPRLRVAPGERSTARPAVTASRPAAGAGAAGVDGANRVGGVGRRWRTTRTLRRLVLAVAGGLLLYAAHPPVDAALAGVLALVPLLLLAGELRAEARAGVGAALASAFGWGWLAGVVFFSPLLWWIERFGVVAWVLLVAVQALFGGLFIVGLAAWRWRGWTVAAVVWWVALEALRGAVPLGGFPWGVLGYSQHDGGPLLGVARALGVLGVSAVCAGLAGCLAAALVRGRRRLSGAAAPLAAVGLILGLSVLVSGQAPQPTARSLDVAAVQGNDIESTSAAGVARVATGRIVRVAEQMVDASRPLAADPPALTVWPENSIDADIADPRNTAVRAQVAAGLRLLDGGSLLAGAEVSGARPGTRYVTMAEITPAGRGQTYVKRKPVPFGEYVPGRRWLGWFPPLRQIPTDVLPGDGPQLLDLAGARLGTLLCFENVFPALARSQVREGAELLIVSTNNASFGRTAMSRQHLAFTQLRAVETGRWVLHAGISGISGVVDPDGRVTQRTELFEAAIVRAELPLVDGTTPATRFGDLPATVALSLSAVGLAAVALDRRRMAAAPVAG